MINNMIQLLVHEHFKAWNVNPTTLTISPNLYLLLEREIQEMHAMRLVDPEVPLTYRGLVVVLTGYQHGALKTVLSVQ